MQKIIDDQRMIYKCCSLYYEDNIGQNQIAKYLGISKSSVSRMLQIGREMGIVEIKVHHLSQYMYLDLEEQLKEKYHLRDVVIAESSPLDSQESRISKLNERAADYCNRLFKDGDHIGVSVGSTLRNIAYTSQDFPKRKCTFVPIVGGMGMEEVQANRVAEMFAQKFGGRFVSFFSPAVFSNERLMKEFLQEESVRFIFDYFEKLDTIVAGMGKQSFNFPTIKKLGFVTREQIDEYLAQGTVGILAYRFLDRNGNMEKFEEFNKRTASISTQMYRNVRNKILVTGGNGKRDVLEGCMNAGFVNILIIDVDCAKELLS